jgi:hypothetical protein
MIKPAPDALAEPFNEVWNPSRSTARRLAAGRYPAAGVDPAGKTGKIKAARHRAVLF